jgi:hypothetical protein
LATTSASMAITHISPLFAGNDGSGVRSAIEADAIGSEKRPSILVDQNTIRCAVAAREPLTQLGSRGLASRALNFESCTGETLVTVGFARVGHFENVVADANGDRLIAFEFRGSQQGFQYGLLLAHDSLS